MTIVSNRNPRPGLAHMCWPGEWEEYNTRCITSKLFEWQPLFSEMLKIQKKHGPAYSKASLTFNILKKF